MCNILQQIPQPLKSLSSTFLERKSRLTNGKEPALRILPYPQPPIEASTDALFLERKSRKQELGAGIQNKKVGRLTEPERSGDERESAVSDPRNLVLKSLHNQEPPIEASTDASSQGAGLLTYRTITRCVFTTFVSFVVVGGSFQSPPSRFARLVVKKSVQIRPIRPIRVLSFLVYAALS